MSDSAFEKCMQKIENGEEIRLLLNFDRKETMGSKSCKNYYDNVHPSDPHASAIKLLTRKERNKRSCVLCHATKKIMEPKSKTMSDDRVEDSVGCEACHGFGAEHVENPTKENIVGLGDSCPECVWESLCTSCYINKWDPELDLYTRLEFYRSNKHKYGLERVKDESEE